MEIVAIQGSRSIRGAPYIFTRSKTLHGPLDEDRALGRAIEANAGIIDVLPVFFGGRLIAFTRGYSRSRVVAWRRARHREILEATITTYDGMIAAATAGKSDMTDWTKTHTTAPIANNYYDLWPVGGKPTAGTYPGAARTAVQWNESSTGAIFHRGNVSPDVKNSRYIFGQATAGATPPTIQLYDRVLSYDACGFASGSNQTMVNTLPAQRYISAGQGGLQLMITVQTVLGTTVTNLTQVSYTDNAGNTGSLVPQTPVPSIIVSAAAPTTTLGARVVAPSTSPATLPWGPYMPLAAGDSGMRAVENYTTSAANTGTMCWVLCKPLATLPLDSAGRTQFMDLVQMTPGMERIYDGACLAIMVYFPVGTAATINGGFGYVWG